MRTNNRVTVKNPEMEDIEISVCRDTIFSQESFNEDYERLKHDIPDYPLWFYTSGEEFVKPACPAQYFNFDEVDEKQARAVCYSDFRNYRFAFDTNTRTYSARDMVEQMQRWGSWKDLLIHNLNDVGWKAVLEASLELPDTHSYVNITGSTQSSWKVVVYELSDDPDSIRHPSRSNDIIKMFENAFFSAPVRAEIVIDGTSYYLHEDLKDPYEWDLDEAKELIDKLDISDKAKEYIKGELPEYPDYNN